MVENFKSDLILRAAQFSHHDILERMGYRHPDFRVEERLKTTLTSQSFGLEAGRFDFRFSDEEFLRTLCRVLGIGRDLTEQRIATIQKHLKEERRAFKPYIWVDTAFTRKNQPVFALAALDHERYLHFSKGFWRKSIDRQLRLAQGKVRAHMNETEGNLGIWGLTLSVSLVVT